MAFVSPTTNLADKPGYIARTTLYAVFVEKRQLGVTVERIRKDLNVARATFFRAIKEHETGDKPDRYIPLLDSPQTEAHDAAPSEIVAQNAKAPA